MLEQTEPMREQLELAPEQTELAPEQTEPVPEQTELRCKQTEVVAEQTEVGAESNQSAQIRVAPRTCGTVRRVFVGVSNRVKKGKAGHVRCGRHVILHETRTTARCRELLPP